jgi:hypothetical protein
MKEEEEMKEEGEEMKEAKAMCEHDWEPIQGWYARYRCARCRVIGYKAGALRPQNARCTGITTYRCEVRREGKRCAEPAVHCWRGKKLRCAAHVRPGKTEKARETLAATTEAEAVVEAGPGAAPEANAEEIS